MSKIDLTTPTKRARLAANKNPYFMSVTGPRGGVSLGWRPGVWIAKLVIDGKRIEGKIAVADDAGFEGIDYKSAVAAALAWADLKRVEDPTIGPLTVATAIAAYVEAKSDGDTTTRLVSRVLADKTFCAIKLASLEARHIEAWRQGNLGGLKASSVNRYLNSVRAALNVMAERHRHSLPTRLPNEIKIGFRKLSVSADDAARPMSVLTDDQVRALIEAAYRQNDDFGAVVLLAAVTGMRFSQLARIKVGDLMIDAVVVPASRKGRNGAAGRKPTRITIEHSVYARLRPATLDENGQPRAGTAPLLMRWHHAHKVGATWMKTERRTWTKGNEIAPDWHAACRAAGIAEGATMYWLRHSSIVRRLLKGMPIRMVAALHDTSALQIENTYGRWVSEADRDLAKLGRLSLVA